jgi:hypothetical protein
VQISGKEGGEVGSADQALTRSRAGDRGEAACQAPAPRRGHVDSGGVGNLGHAKKLVVALIESDGHLG